MFCFIILICINCGTDYAVFISIYDIISTCTTVADVSTSFKCPVLVSIIIITQFLTQYHNKRPIYMTQRYQTAYTMSHDAEHTHTYTHTHTQYTLTGAHTDRRTDRQTDGTNTWINIRPTHWLTGYIKQLTERRLIQSTCTVMMQYIIVLCRPGFVVSWFSINTAANHFSISIKKQKKTADERTFWPFSSSRRDILYFCCKEFAPMPQ